MSELRIVEGTTRSLLGGNHKGSIVSSSFEYVQGSLNSPFIITSSAANGAEKVLNPARAHQK